MQEKKSSISSNEPISIFMIDVDKFKKINDKYGHVEGDSALKIVANALKITSQQMGGFVVRYGGDEFCYILSGKDIAPDLVKSCIRKNLEEMQMKEQQNKGYSLLVSIGYSTISNAETDIRNGIVQADKLLYEDKKREINSK